MKILIWSLITLFSANSMADGTFYMEMGGFYSQDRVWYLAGDGSRLSESGITGHLAAGYERSFINESLIFDLQVRHGSDPKKSGENDITAHEEIGLVVRVNIY